jgi:FMN phosphatase YigB (HAD superfamily)
VHVGDLRRSDIAGARSVGMGSVRIAAHHDDSDGGPAETAGVIDCGLAGCAPPCPRPEADAIASSHAHLLELLAYE